MITRYSMQLLIGAALLLAAADPALAQVRRPRPSATTPPASQLARPATAPDAAALLAAYRTALRQPAVQRVTRASLQQQLRTTWPIALVNGYWVTPVDLAATFRDRTVSAALGQALPGSPLGAILDDPAARLGLAFTHMSFADAVIGDMAQDLGTSLAENAFLENATGIEPFSLTGILITIGLGAAGGIIANTIYDYWTNEPTPTDPNTGLPINHPQADPDGDAQLNASDTDDDNDGAPDSEDQHPHDPNKTMCPPELCGHRAVIAFGTNMTDQVLSAVLQAFGTATAPGQTASLAAAGRLPAFTLVFPTTGLR